MVTASGDGASQKGLLPKECRRVLCTRFTTQRRQVASLRDGASDWVTEAANTTRLLTKKTTRGPSGRPRST